MLQSGFAQLSFHIEDLPACSHQVMHNIFVAATNLFLQKQKHLLQETVICANMQSNNHKKIWGEYG
jgi:hypothetical protein